MRDIYHVRLINGEELIAILKKDNEHTVTLETPLVVEEIGDEEGSHKVLQNYIKFTNEVPTCDFRKDHIIVMFKAGPEVSRYYLNSLYFTDEYDKEFLYKLKSANEKMEEYMEAKEPFVIDDTETLKNPFYHNLSSNTAH